MGQWNTLHTFDEKLYQTKTLRLLEDERALLPYYQNYKTLCIPGTCKLTPLDFIRYATDCRQQIADLFVVGCTKDENMRLPLPPEYEYTFVDLFTYLIFQTAARYYPYFRLGYRALDRAVRIQKRESVADQILRDLFRSCGEFARDGSGIRKIFTVVDVKMLALDLDNLAANAEEGDFKRVEDFKQYVTYLADRDLGILSGLDLVPAQFEHIDSELPDLRDLNIESLRYRD